MLDASKIWRVRGLALAISACALAISACGGGDDSTSTEEAAEPVARAAAPGDQGPASGRGEQEQSAKPRATNQQRNGKGDGNVEPPAAPVSSDEARRVQPRPAGGTAPADKPRRKPRNPKAKPPKLPPPGKAKVKPPPFLPGGGGDPYQVARQLCGDRQLVESIPPEYRGTAEEMATMYAELFDPDNKEQAYEGCLAGLRSLGY